MRDDDGDPFGRLDNTHRRIEERLADLERAAAGVSDTTQRFEALDALYDVLGFFQRAAARHHEDEELSLFPRLAGAAEATPVVTALHEEHLAQAKAFDEMGAFVRAFPPEGPEPPEERKLIALAKAFAASYRDHITKEEQELFPLAKKLLGEEDRAAILAEMHARRPGRGQHRGG